MVPPQHTRPNPHLVFCDPDFKDEAPTGFTAKPADDIPNNRLTEKLARGVQSYVQRMQKREGYRIQVVSSPMQDNYVPPPRECATLTSNGFDSYLIGGASSEPIPEVSKA